MADSIPVTPGQVFVRSELGRKMLMEAKLDTTHSDYGKHNFLAEAFDLLINDGYCVAKQGDIFNAIMEQMKMRAALSRLHSQVCEAESKLSPSMKAGVSEVKAILNAAADEANAILAQTRSNPDE